MLYLTIINTIKLLRFVLKDCCVATGSYGFCRPCFINAAQRCATVRTRVGPREVNACNFCPGTRSIIPLVSGMGGGPKKITIHKNHGNLQER